MKKFVVVVDAQVDFCLPGGALYVNGAVDTIGPMSNFLFNLKEDDIEGVLFTKDTHIPGEYEQSEEAKQFPPHCLVGTRGHDIVFPVETVIDDGIPIYYLEKGVFNMWEEPKLDILAWDVDEEVDREEFFRELHRNGVNDVIVLGHAANFCVKWAVDGLIEHGFKVELMGDLTRGIDIGGGENDTVPEKIFKDYIAAGQMIVIR